MTEISDMTIDEYAARYIKRQSILSSCLMNGNFSVHDAIRHLSSGRKDKQPSADATREFLDAMVKDGLLKRTAERGKARWCRVGSATSVRGSWGVTDNGVRLGMHQPPVFGAARGLT